MSARVMHFPVPATQRVCEPIRVRWVTMSWLTMPDGSEATAQTRKRLDIRADGTWTLSSKMQGDTVWRHVTGDHLTPAGEYFEAMLGVQFLKITTATA